MEISDVRVRLVQDANERLKAVCSLTFDDIFVVRDVKIVEGTHGLFVAMPSRKLSVGCPKCRGQNHLRARFCNECGVKLPTTRIPSDGKGREKAHRDIAHPITPSFRETVQERVLEAYRTECEEGHDEDAEDTGFLADEVDGDYDDRSDQDGDELTEYGALIADLKGGKRASGRPPREERSRRQEAPRGERRWRRQRNGRPEESGRPRDQRRGGEDRAVAGESGRESRKTDKPRAESVAPSVAAGPAKVSVDEDDFAAGLLDSPSEEPKMARAASDNHESPKPPPDRPSESAAPEDRAEEPTSSDRFPEQPLEGDAAADDEDDTAFGAGIL